MSEREAPDHHSAANTVYAASLEARKKSAMRWVATVVDGLSGGADPAPVSDLVIYKHTTGELVARREYESILTLEAEMQEIVTDLERLYPDEFAAVWLEQAPEQA